MNTEYVLVNTNVLPAFGAGDMLALTCAGFFVSA